jgi:hypothetical protein
MSTARRPPRVVIHVGDVVLDAADPALAARLSSSLRGQLVQALREAGAYAALRGQHSPHVATPPPTPGQEPQATARRIAAAVLQHGSSGRGPRGGSGEGSP